LCGELGFICFVSVLDFLLLEFFRGILTFTFSLSDTTFVSRLLLELKESVNLRSISKESLCFFTFRFLGDTFSLSSSELELEEVLKLFTFSIFDLCGELGFICFVSVLDFLLLEFFRGILTFTFSLSGTTFVSKSLFVSILLLELKESVNLRSLSKESFCFFTFRFLGDIFLLSSSELELEEVLKLFTFTIFDLCGISGFICFVSLLDFLLLEFF